MTLLGYYNGMTRLNPIYEMDSCLSGRPPAEEPDRFGWEDEYLDLATRQDEVNITRDLPRPGVYKNKPILYGNFDRNSLGGFYNAEVYTPAFSLDFWIKLVRIEDIRLPNESEYDKYFRVLFNNRKVYIDCNNRLIIQNPAHTNLLRKKVQWKLMNKNSQILKNSKNSSET